MIVLIMISILGLYGFLIEPYEVEVRHLWIQCSVFADVLEGRVGIHISDLHISEIGRREKKVLELVKAINPDIIFLSGDYIKWGGNLVGALNFLSKLKARKGVWAVMGDYDYGDSRKSCRFCHEENTGRPTRLHGVRFLRNSLEPVNFTGGKLYIAGIDGESDLPFNFEGYPVSFGHEDVPAIVLSHSPLIFERLDNERAVLVLSGDTHGGQVPLPSWLWGILGYEKNARYNQGIFQEGRKMMYVSRGIGTSHIPFRFLRRPELVVLHFGKGIFSHRHTQTFTDG